MEETVQAHADLVTRDVTDPQAVADAVDELRDMGPTGPRLQRATGVGLLSFTTCATPTPPGW